MLKHLGEKAAKRSCGCSIPGGIRGQIEWGIGQPDQVSGSPVHGRGIGNGWTSRSFPTQAVQ